MTERTGASLEAVGVHKRYGATTALDGVTLRVEPGECVALVGESGSGKTTLLRCFNRMVSPDRGQILLDGAAALTADPIGVRRATGYVPQEGGLLPHWTVRRNVALVPTLLRHTQALAEADTALQLVGLDPAVFGTRWPRELSGGQRQRVAIARAIAAGPRALLLDEPFGALDAITRSEVQDAFATLRQSLRITAVLVTHDLHEALTLADRVAVLRVGRLEQLSTPSDLVSHPATPYVASLLQRARLGGGGG